MEICFKFNNLNADHHPAHYERAFELRPHRVVHSDSILKHRAEF